MTEVKQIKLIGGEEVLCDLVGIELDEYDNEVMVIRAAYSLISQEDFESALAKISRSVGKTDIDKYEKWREEFGAQ